MGAIKNKIIKKKREKCGIFIKKRFYEENLKEACKNLNYPLKGSCIGSGHLVLGQEKPPKGTVKTDYHPRYNYIRKICINCPYYRYAKNEKEIK